MYAIRKIRNFYGPRTERSYVQDGWNGGRAEFRFKAEAESLKAVLDGAQYVTAHGETGRAEYRIVRVNAT